MASWLAGVRQWNGRDWISVVGLLAVLGVLGFEVISVWAAAFHPSAAGCHNAPLKTVREPQLVGIAVSIAGLVLGRLTARPAIQSRRELVDKLVPSRSWEEHRKIAFRVQLGLTLALLFITFLVTFEALTLWRGVWPITYFVRCAAEAATWQTYLGAAAFCALVGRWMWLPRTPRWID